MWLLVVFRYRASVRLSKISKVEIYTPQMKFLATPLTDIAVGANTAWSAAAWSPAGFASVSQFT